MIVDIHASYLTKVMNCLNAAHLYNELPDNEENDMAKQGTAAAEYLEHLIKGVNPIPSHAKNGWMFDSDIKILIQRIRGELPALGVKSECYVPWFTRSGIEIKGTYDAAYVIAEEDMLCIDDLKFGYGIVEVEDNWQLIAYAIGEVINTSRAYSKYRLRILQPRAHHEDGPVRETFLTYEELLNAKEEIELRCEQLKTGDRTSSTSSKCRYCKGSAEVCPAFNRTYHAALEYVMTKNIKDSITDEEVGKQLDEIARVKEILKTKEYSLQELAISRIKDNKIIPNYISKPSYGHRSWKSGVNIDTVKILTGGKVDLTDLSMMTPAQAEGKGLGIKLLDQLCERKYSGHKLTRYDATKIAEKAFNKKK